MSKRQFKSQASSSRVSAGGFGAFGGFGSTSGSSLSYLSEPPNLTAISDANVVVAFKNLLKKDSTTKTKGLEELLGYVQAHPFEQDGGVEQPVLESWVKLYPRISIDNSRRARELAHILQYELLKSARKRMEKFIPSIVGAWLAGTFDRDRQVSRAAQDGISSFLDTEDKILVFWKRCQPQLISYAQEAIEETPDTLSDERTVTADDMKAKYDRVIGSSLSLVVNLLVKLPLEDLQKQQEAYEGFLANNKTLWNFAASDDSFVRRTTCELLQISIQKQESIISQDLQLISSAFISDGLKTPQVSSTVQLLQALIVLSTKFPEVWTTYYKSKKSPFSRLRHFIEKGSRAGPPEFWRLWNILLKKLPGNVLPKDLEGSLEFLKAQRDGMSSREESRSNVAATWNSYIETVKLLMPGAAGPGVSKDIIASAVLPAFEQYLRPSTENSQWSVGGNVNILVKLFELCTETGEQDALKAEWRRLADAFIETMLVSQPEKSKDYSKSQMAVISDAKKWFSLQAEIAKVCSTSSDLALLSEESGRIVFKAIETVVKRNGKPFGAAGTLESALSLGPAVITTSQPTMDSLTKFLEESLPHLIASPSSIYLIRALNAFQKLPGNQKAYDSIWEATIDGLLTPPISEEKIPVVSALMANESAGRLAQEDKFLQEYLQKSVITALEGYAPGYALLEAAIINDCLDSDSKTTVTNHVADLLGDMSTSPEKTFDVLEMIISKKPSMLDEKMLHVTLMTRLLAIGESQNQDLVTRAAALRTRLEVGSSPDLDSSASVVRIVQDNLENAGPHSLSIDTLIEQSSKALAAGVNYAPSDLFPKPEIWLSHSLRSLLSSLPNPATALTNPLGGAVFMVESPSLRLDTVPDRDTNGFSIPFRKAIYASKLISDPKIRVMLPLDLQVDIFRILCITVELGNDQLGLREQNQLWGNIESAEIESEIQDFLSNTQKLLASIFDSAVDWRKSGDSESIASRLIKELLRGSQARSATAFYQARALSVLLSNAVEANGWQTAGGEEWLESLDLLKSNTTKLFAAVAVLAGLEETLGSSKIVNTLCNRLISDIAGASFKTEKTLGTIVYLNAVLSLYDIGELPIPQNRLVFAVRQLSSWMEEDVALSPALATEVLRCLQSLFPCIAGVYGSHWALSLDFCLKSMSDPASGRRLDSVLPLYYASMKTVILCRNLLRVADAEEKNDDIEDALKQITPDLPTTLLHLLKLQRTEENQPWTIVDQLLIRELEAVPVSALNEPEDIYPLIASDFSLVQTAAYGLLQRFALEHAESINYDTVLEKHDAALSPELLSLLLENPVYENYPEERLVQFPSTLRSYLLAWHIVFDNYTNASYKVRSDYSENLRRGDYLTPLLNFLFEVLGHSIARAINLDKAGITSDQVRAYDYKSATAETPEHDMQSLLVNLYYQCLKYIPSLAKSWWIDCKSKTTRIAVESWTERYFSPLIIEDTLDEVAKWAEEQEEPADDEKELIVKVSRKSREVYAGYEVDDMQAQIVIRLPATYPLEGVKVESVNRVAVTEKKWQSWLMITQGVVTFSNGSITDGLSVFRKNVMGALKGQTECAICYSIVSSDRKMPDKRCQTCKNLFHSSCLFKWFKSSNQSTCPLCRNPFAYGDVGGRRSGQ